MSFDNDVAASFEELRISHEAAIDMLVDVSEGEDDNDQSGDQDNDYDYNMAGGSPIPSDWLTTGNGDGPVNRSSSCAGSVASQASSLPVGASALSTPPSSVALGGAARSRESAAAAAVAKSSQSSQRTAAVSLGVRPQFNLESAAALLTAFRDTMLAHFPCIALDEASTVADLAREQPFVLLAVLATASSTRTLQGHSLYDAEFRKILGLKFVAGGERSLELLRTSNSCALFPLCVSQMQLFAPSTCCCPPLLPNQIH